MNIFADFEARVASSLAERVAAGALPQGLDLGRFVVEPPRDPAHGDLAANAAMVYAKEAKAAGSNPRALAESLAEGLRKGEDVAAVEVAGPGFLNIRLKPAVFEGVAAHRVAPGRRLRSRRSPRRRPDQRRICERQPDRADACRPCARRGVRRRARQSAGLRRP